MKHKKVLYISISVILIFLILSAACMIAQGGLFLSDPVVEAKADNCYEDTLYVITDRDYLPYSFYDKEGKVSGHDVELITLIANDLQMNLDLELMAWDEAIDSMVAGKADVLMTCDYSDSFEGVDSLLKTEPVSEDEFVVYSQKPIKSSSEIYNMRIAVMKNGNVIPQMVRMNLESSCKRYKDNRSAMLAVENGEVDCAIMRYTVGEALIKELNLKDVFGTVSVGQSYMCFCVSVDEPEMLDKVNAAIERLKINGEIDRLQDKWLTSFVHTYSIIEMLINNTWIVFVITLLVIVIMLFLLAGERKKRQTETEKNRFVEIIENLANDFECVNYIEIKNGKLDEDVVLVRTSDTLNRNIPNWKIETKFTRRQQMFIDCIVAPEDKDTFAEATQLDKVQESIQKDGIFFYDFRAMIDGKTKFYQLKVSSVLDDNGKMTALVLGIHDVSEEIQESTKKQKLLEEALNMAQSANKAKTIFLNNMSHDIRTPMNAIIGYTGLASTHIDDRAKVQDYLSKIGQSSDHLLSLINDVLDMSRIEAGKMNMDEKPEDLNEIINGLRDIVQADVHAKNHEFSINTVNLTDTNVICDKLRLNQILLNILSNSIKYTNNGGSISLNVTQKDIKSSVYGTYEFRIKDNGIGMDQEYLKYIFDPFTRVKSSTVSGIQGTGLGMAITKNLVDMMGGTIEIISEPGEGTDITVTFEFKIQKPDADNGDDIHNPDNECDLAGKKVLLVEDNELNREIATELLRDYGMVVDIAEDGTFAVEKIKNASDDAYDLILMDVQMPIMDGYEATRQIRALGTKISTIPILAMTANAFEEDRKLAFEAGMNEHIAKPIKIEQLKEMLTKFL